VPAPAVIPALRAYINAVAVKGFVVELRTAPGTQTVQTLWVSGQALAVREHHSKETHIGGMTYSPNYACNVCRRAPSCFTVTKKARLKQSS